VARPRGQEGAFESANLGKRYGVGFAQVQKDFGNGADAAITTLSVDPSGRLSMRQNGNDMGTGLSTSQAVMVAKAIGRVPERCAFGVADWPENAALLAPRSPSRSLSRAGPARR